MGRMNKNEFRAWFEGLYDDIVFTMAASGDAQLHSDVFELPEHENGLDISKIRDIWPTAPLTVLDGVVVVDVCFSDSNGVEYSAVMSYPNNFVELIGELACVVDDPSEFED